MKRGDQVKWLQYDMPGEVVDVRDNDIQITWDEGYDCLFSGRTNWGWMPHISLGQIKIEGENGSEPEPTPTLQSAFQLAFTLEL